MTGEQVANDVLSIVRSALDDRLKLDTIEAYLENVVKS